MRNHSLWFTCCGVVGFCFACFILFGTCGKTKSTFHEIGYNPVYIARQMLQDKKEDLCINLKKLDDTINSFKPKDDEKWKQRITKKYSADSLLLHHIESRYFTIHADTNTWKKAHTSLRTFVTLDSLLFLDSIYTSSPNLQYIPVKFAFDDTNFKSEESYKNIHLPVKNIPVDIDFFSKYPGFGIWAFLIIVFISCVFMTIPYCIDALNQLSKLAKNAGCYKKGIYWISLGCSIVLIAAFIGGIMYTLYDSDAIKDIYFMRNLRFKIRTISIVGYIGAACCFAGMLSASFYARHFIDRIPPETDEQKKLKEEISLLEASKDPDKEIELNEKRELLRLSKRVTPAERQLHMKADIESIEKSLGEADPVQKAALEIELSKKKEQSKLFDLRLAAVVSDYAQLNNIFRRFFYAISLLLALLVFSTGALYTAVDSIDFMQMIKQSLGFASARPDFVYLYGALHTLLILLFYLPAKFQLAGYKSSANSNTTEDKKSWIKSLAGPMKKLPDLLIATAPLLASLVQWALSLVFGE